MTYNIEDLRTTDLQNLNHPRAVAAARTLQELRPDILLINEITYDVEGAPGYRADEGDGYNATRFAVDFLQRPHDSALVGLEFRAYSAPSNTGVASGFDLDNNGLIVTNFPPPAASDPTGAPARQTAEQRAYGGDAWGFGTFPGQYAMALFVSKRYEIIYDSVRTFQNFLWARMPDALRPTDPATGEPWYSEEEWTRFRLSSKSHWDIPVRLPNGRVLHVLASHPTPPAFDGPEQRNKKRNHDEIRFWIDYIDGADYITDDSGRRGGLHPNASFVIMGDLNADPDEGSTIGSIASRLLSHPRVNGDFVPQASGDGILAYADLDPDDTAEWGRRVDYVLPSTDLSVLASGIWRPEKNVVPASDHFPVWVDLIVGDTENITGNSTTTAQADSIR